MSDLVERLRRLAFLEHGAASSASREAADEIERLRAERDEAVALLEEILDSGIVLRPRIEVAIDDLLARVKP